jgi:ribosomal protein S27AE
VLLSLGRLLRVLEECGTVEMVEAHHEDYEYPLRVKWLCKLHHESLHKSTGTFDGVVNIRGVDRSLIRAMKSEAAKTGRTLRDWVIWVWAANVGWEARDGLGKVSAVAERVERPAVAADGHADVVEAGPVAEDEKLCPECGEAVVWNKVMKWWECTDQSCQWHGKKER